MTYTHLPWPVFERAIDANPRLGEAWSNLASCLDLLGQPEEACEAYATAESCGYKTAFLYDNWGNALSHRERLSEAEQKYRQALNLDETLSEAKANLGLTLISMGRIEEGQSLTAAAWATEPSNQALASISLFSCAIQFKR